MPFSLPRPPDPLVARDVDLRRWRASLEGVEAVADLRPRQEGTCVGVVKAILLVPRERLEVTVEDGSGEITAVFPGRTRLPGVELASGLRLVGTVASDPDGELRMMNPAWTPVAGPER